MDLCVHSGACAPSGTVPPLATILKWAVPQPRAPRRGSFVRAGRPQIA